MTKRTIRSTLISIIILLIFTTLFQKAWDNGKPETIQLKGVPNLHQVSTTLYRSAQPTKTGMSKIEERGIKTIINLRYFHSDKDSISGTNLNNHEIPMGILPPSEKDLVQFLRICTDTSQTPVLVHCYAGSDRTGVMVAAYRVVVEEWAKEKAIDEMMRGGYGFKWFLFHLAIWLNSLDVQEVQTKLMEKASQ